MVAAVGHPDPRPARRDERFGRFGCAIAFGGRLSERRTDRPGPRADARRGRDADRPADAARSEGRPAAPERDPAGEARADRRLNVLLTDRGADWADQLPELLKPQGVHAFRVSDPDKAVELIEATPIHVAVLDMYLDADPDEPPRAERLPAGLKLLRVIQRIDRRPPAVMVVRNRYFDPRIDNFVLAEALKLNAFSVLDQPVRLEQLLAVLHRALERYFGGHWPQD